MATLYDSPYYTGPRDPFEKYSGKQSSRSNPTLSADSPSYTGKSYDSTLKTSSWRDITSVAGAASGGGSSKSRSDDDSARDYAKEMEERKKEEQKEAERALAKQKEQDLKTIESEYSDLMNYYGGLENQTNQRYGEAIGRVEGYWPQFESMVGKEREGRRSIFGQQEGRARGDAEAAEISTRQESNNAMAQARQLLNDLQRRDSAYLSARGNYGSHIPEALAERFSRKSFDTLGTIQERRDSGLRDVESKRESALLEIADRRDQAESFYQNKLFSAKQSYDEQVSGLKGQLMSALDQITQAKGAAQSAKRAATLDAWRNYTNAKIQLDQNVNSYLDSVNMWKANMDKELAGATQYNAGSYSSPGYSEYDASDALGSLGQSVAGANAGQNLPQDETAMVYNPNTVWKQGQDDEEDKLASMPSLVQKYLS